ncbi:MAG: efflux RND transporter periplasmic adaptor subunit [Chloroflexota bacterium]|nr:MAG: efflux RND transporter periplasmic adaptor subunit [Chloroflexota bacterium]
MKKQNKKWFWVIGGTLLVAAAVLGLAILPQVRDRAEAQTPAGQDSEIVTAFSGDLSASVSGSGQVQAGQEARLAMGASGTVAELFVQVGDSVEAGQALVRLDTGDLERAVEAAEQSLVIQEANLAMLTAPPTAQSLAAAEAAVASAQAQLDDLLDGPSAEDVEASEANVRAAQANVWAASEQLALSQSGASEAEIASAQAELIGALGQQESTQDMYDNLLKCVSFDLPTGESREICPGLGAPEEQTRASLEAAKASVTSAQARLDGLMAGADADAVAIAQAGVAASQAQLEAAQANHELLLKGASEAQIAAAGANLAQAEANLATLMDGPSEAQLVAAETAVVQAQVALERARLNLVDAILTAPFSGTVTAVNVGQGEAANGIVLELADSTNLQVVLDVDEVDIGNIGEGQPALITLEAWPDETISGRVRAIAPDANQDTSAVVSFEVTIDLEESDAPLLVGMTADATLTTAGYEDVLLVPNQAINADRASGRYMVNLVEQDSSGERLVTEVEVTLGLRDGGYTQIVEGLTEGDQLLVGNSLPVQSFGPDEGNGPFGGRG